MSKNSRASSSPSAPSEFNGETIDSFRYEQQSTDMVPADALLPQIHATELADVDPDLTELSELTEGQQKKLEQWRVALIDDVLARYQDHPYVKRKVRRHQVGRAGACKDDDSHSRYLAEIGTSPLLSKDYEVSLFHRFNTGMNWYLSEGAPNSEDISVATERLVLSSVAAYQMIFLSNTRLVVSIAKRFRTPDISPLELISEGNIGLNQAIKKFDASLGYKFSTFATERIERTIKSAIKGMNRPIRLPAYRLEQLSVINSTSGHLQDKLRRTPSRQELSQATGIDCQTIEELQIISRGVASINQPIGYYSGTSPADNNSELSELLTPASTDTSSAGTEPEVDQSVADQLTYMQTLEAIMDGLNSMQKEVIHHRFGLDDGQPKILEEVGDMFGVSRQWISQVEKKALKLMRQRAHQLNIDMSLFMQR